MNQISRYLRYLAVSGHLGSPLDTYLDSPGEGHQISRYLASGLTRNGRRCDLDTERRSREIRVLIISALTLLYARSPHPNQMPEPTMRFRHLLIVFTTSWVFAREEESSRDGQGQA